MRQFSYLQFIFQFVLTFFILKSEAQSNSLNCDFNANDCAWYSSDSLLPAWKWTGILESDDGHGGYLEIPTIITSYVEQLVSTTGLSTLAASVNDLWHVRQSGCFTFSYRFYSNPNSKLSLTLEHSSGEKKELWNINNPQSIGWSRASVYIDSSNSDFRLHFTANINLVDNLGLKAEWVVSLDDFTFSDTKCFESTQKVTEVKTDETVPDIMPDIGETIYTSGSLDIEELACFSFTYFYTITNSKNVGSLSIMLETMSSDGKQAAEPRRILPIERISLQRELSLNRNHFERTIIVDQKSFYTISLVYADRVHSSVVLVDDVSIKMEHCSNESPKQDSDTTVVHVTETPTPTTTECCVTEPCICVKSTPEMPTFNPSVVRTFVTPSIISTVPISTVRIDRETSLTPILATENTISESTTQLKKVVATQDQSPTFETLSSTPTIFSTENTIFVTSTTQSTEAQTKDQSTTLTSFSSTKTPVHSQTNETPLDVTSSKSELQSTSMDYIVSTTAVSPFEKTEITNYTEAVATTIDHQHETFESSTKNILTTNYENTEPFANITQTPQVILDNQTVEYDDKTNTFNAINFGNLGRNLITIFKYFFGERSLIASLSGLAGLSILMISIMILVLNWKNQDNFQKRPVVLSTLDGELELNAYTFRRRTITLSRLEDMSNSKPPLKFSKAAEV